MRHWAAVVAGTKGGDFSSHALTIFDRMATSTVLAISDGGSRRGCKGRVCSTEKMVKRAAITSGALRSASSMVMGRGCGDGITRCGRV